MTLLVILDMQELYKEDLTIRGLYQPLVNRIVDKVYNHFEEDSGNRVISLFTRSEGPFFPPIVRAVCSGPNVFLQKTSFCGSRPILSYLKREKLQEEAVELCGIYENCCVLLTWKGLKRQKVEVLPVSKKLTAKSLFKRRGEEWKYPKGYLVDPKPKTLFSEEISW